VLADLHPLRDEMHFSLLIYSQDITGANFHAKFAFFTNIQIDCVFHCNSGIVIFFR
jgi:hypothetical protein